MSTSEIIRSELIAMTDSQNKLFVQKLIPTIAAESILGIRTPVLRNYAKELRKHRPEMIDAFLYDLPHYYLEENNLHGFLLEGMKDFDQTLSMTEAFLPYIDNWATCDTFHPKIFKKYPALTYERILSWIASDHPYTVRYGIGLLLSDYLDAQFSSHHLELVCQINTEEYYVQMMIAWYFSVALVKQYESTLPYLLDRRLSPWIHNKTIQKAIESRRISDLRKDDLRALRIKTSPKKNH